jgi:uncharacterized 2Fe-2S/4Fe-4S cluster protein (DUF4445 family)
MTRKTIRKKIRINFSPSKEEISCLQGVSLLEAALHADVPLTASCGGMGICGSCKIVVEKGEVKSKRTPSLSDEEYSKGIRQACQCKVMSDVTVSIPITSRLEAAVISQEAALSNGANRFVVKNWKYNPSITKLWLNVKPPSIKDNSSDLSRLLRALRGHKIKDNTLVEPNVLNKLASILRHKNCEVTATVLRDGHNCRLINLEAGDTMSKLYCLVFDIGTTGVRGQLLDLNTGQIIAQGLDYNRQIAFGDDVISRITYCRKKGNLLRLQNAVAATLNDIIADMLAQSNLKKHDISHVILAGNTTMTQLVYGLDPEYLRLFPYVPTVSEFPLLNASYLKLNLPKHIYVYALPCVSSYVGGDIVSGVLGIGMGQRPDVTLYIDIGTNGEIALGNCDWIVTTSCSAGPAFEGGGIKHGMLASPGAIEDFTIDTKTKRVKISTLGDSQPKGICGAGLINIAAELLRHGFIDRRGKFTLDSGNLGVRQGKDGVEYLICSATESATGEDIVITEIDMDNLIRAKGAMYAGYQTLLRSVGLAFDDVASVIVAGTFGSSIDIESAITIGLLPDIDRERIVFAGNGSLLGARLSAFSRQLIEEGKKLARMMTNIELSDNADFMNNFIASLFLPHTDLDSFPNIKDILGGIEDGVTL